MRKSTFFLLLRYLNAEFDLLFWHRFFYDCDFRLRQALLLVCLVEGGNPAPKVVWWRDGVAWDNEGDPSTYEDVLQNTLVNQNPTLNHLFIVWKTIFSI